MSRYIGLILLLWGVNLSAQHQKDTIHKTPAPIIKNLKDFLLKGHANGHLRNYFMATINHDVLKDYHTNAVGGALSYHTAKWHGLQLGVKGIFSFKTFSSDLTKIDSLSHKYALWETELYDITRPNEGLDLDRLEELYLQYTYRNANIRLGKIDIDKAPLLLKRDGRMKPFVYNGAWLAWKDTSQHHLYLGWLYQVSPRGITEWYSIEEAIGIVNNGYQPNGQKAHYQHHQKSAGLGVIGYEGQLLTGLTINLWNYYLDNINNTLWIQSDYKQERWYGGIQYALQVVHPYQRTLDYEHRYQQPDEIAQVLSTQLGYKFLHNKLDLSIAYAHNFAGGRFLFPKEMGREGFYVSHPRSWVEGYAQRNDFLLHLLYHPLQHSKKLAIDCKLAWIDLPDTYDYQNNKYQKTDYLQTTLEINYTFNKALKGLKIYFLYIYKYTPNSYSVALADAFYQTNLHHFNLITEIKF
ncbi:MAG: hypothetical protein ACRBFS_01145 [Aureispira sp.]